MPAPAEDRLPVDVAYATRTYRLPDDALDGDLACVHGPSAGSPRGGALARVEGDRWMVTLYGLCGDRPPTDPDGFDAFARSLRVGDIHEALRLGDPVDDPTPFRYPADVRRRFERARRLPAGFVVLGDALCSLNPVYGQGMTVAALHALALRDCLRRHGEVVPRAVHSAAARATDAAWAMATGADLALPEVEGRRGPQVRLTNAYLGRLLAAAAHDPVVAVAFTRVTGLVDAPTSLLRPALAARVLRPRRRTHSPGHPPAAPARSPKAGAVAEGRP